MINGTGKTTRYGFIWGPMEVTKIAGFEPRKGRECRVVRCEDTARRG